MKVSIEYQFVTFEGVMIQSPLNLDTFEVKPLFIKAQQEKALESLSVFRPQELLI
jgi:hypothetical protein